MFVEKLNANVYDHIPVGYENEHLDVLRRISEIDISIYSQIRESAQKRGVNTPADDEALKLIYAHCVLLAHHASGIITYNNNLPLKLIKDFTPYLKLILYIKRRLYNTYHDQIHGVWDIYKEQFGVEFADRRVDQNGKIRKRFKALQEIPTRNQAR